MANLTNAGGPLDEELRRRRAALPPPPQSRRLLGDFPILETVAADVDDLLGDYRARIPGDAWEDFTVGHDDIGPLAHREAWGPRTPWPYTDHIPGHAVGYYTIDEEDRAVMPGSGPLELPWRTGWTEIGVVEVVFLADGRVATSTPPTAARYLDLFADVLEHEQRLADTAARNAEAAAAGSSRPMGLKKRRK